MKKIIPSLCLFLLVSVICFSQPQTDTTKLAIAEIKNIHSKILSEERTVYIYRPLLSTATPLPVLYLLDGDAHMLNIVGQVQYLSEMYRDLPNLMIVGIANYKYNRFRDLTPTNVTTFNGAPVDPSWQQSGGADKFIAFIEKELIPWTEKNYATIPFRVLSGHSLGGLTVLHAMQTKPSIFNAYITVSPSLWWDEKKELKQILEKVDVHESILFMSDGKEGGAFHESVVEADSAFRKTKNTASYRYKHYGEETHSTVPLRTNIEALQFIFNDWALKPADSTLSAIKNKFALLGKKFNLRIDPPEATLIDFCFQQQAKGDLKAAAETAAYIIQVHPKSAMGYVMRAEIFERGGDKAAALFWYKKAAAIDPNEPELKRRISALEK